MSRSTGQWLPRNFERYRLLSGLLCFIAVANALVHGNGWILYAECVLIGVLGAWFVGGWPALRRLLRSPKMQLRHWYGVLIDARKLHHYHREDGTVEVVRMRPTLHGGWSWREERRWERGDRVSLDEEVSEA